MASWKSKKMPFQRLILTFFSFALLACMTAVPAHADPVFFSNVVALQNDGATRVDLFSQPEVQLIGPNLSFLVDISGPIPPSPSQALSIIFTEAGRAPVTQTFQFFPGLPNQFSFLFSVTALGATSQGIDATLIVDILGSDPDVVNPGNGQSQNSYTYNFRIVQPVPEPASMILISLGLVGLFERSRRGRRLR